MKKRLTQIAKELGMTYGEATELAKSKLSADMMTGGAGMIWIDDRGQEILDDCLETPELVPKHYRGQVLKPCPNPHYVYAAIKELGKRVPVAIPNRFKGKLIGKMINIECIADDIGESYRYVK